MNTKINIVIPKTYTIGSSGEKVGINMITGYAKEATIDPSDTQCEVKKTRINTPKQINAA